jgi:hypothetical protein
VCEFQWAGLSEEEDGERLATKCNRWKGSVCAMNVSVSRAMMVVMTDARKERESLR